MQASPTIVIATRNRRSRLLATLRTLEALRERPRIIVVDNGSEDGFAAAIKWRHPRVRVLGRYAVADAAQRPNRRPVSSASAVRTGSPAALATAMA